MNLRLFGEFTLVCPLLLLAGLLSGCFSSSDSKNISGIAVEALPPVFLTGPAAAVLTNAGAFSAHVVMSNHLRMPKTVSGELFARAGKLLFAAEPGGKVWRSFWLFIGHGQSPKLCVVGSIARLRSDRLKH